MEDLFGSLPVAGNFVSDFDTRTAGPAFAIPFATAPSVPATYFTKMERTVTGGFLK
ncbi:hypothetical protein [Variovorax sp. YR216]|uniref:hypothetical protein n=1 Tax=Variovorax sp. YR216 TaxID=1882828 RepID=UPI0015A429C3|nr:hypothetical protein [Variovorax sp. YR216]